MSEEKRKPWFPFYPADWRGDVGLRACSLSARGLWIELVGIMHEADEPGFLLINGAPAKPSKLAGIIGIPADKIAAAIKELEENRVFSRDETGRIYSRKMVRSARKSAAASASSRARWDAEKQEEIADTHSERKKSGYANDDAKRIPHVGARDRDLRVSDLDKGSVSKDTGDERLEMLLESVVEDGFDNSADAWSMAKYVLVTRGGLTLKAAGTLVGKFMRDYSLTVEQLARLASATWQAGSEDPVPLMQATAKGLRTRQASPRTPYKARQEEREESNIFDDPKFVEQRFALEFWKRWNCDPDKWDRLAWGHFMPPSPTCQFNRALLREFGIACAPYDGPPSPLIGE